MTAIPPFRQIARLYAAATTTVPQGLARIAEIQEQTAAREGEHAAEIIRAVAALRQSLQALETTKPAGPQLFDRLGLRLLLDPTSLVDRCVIDSGSWEPEQTAFFIGLTKRLLLKTPVVFLDLGSYWGLYSLLAMRAGVRRVYTFDADRHNFSQLQAQIFLNDATEVVRPFNKAISSEAATLTFWDSRAHPDKNRAGAGVVPVDLGLPTYEVDAVAIDDFLPLEGETVMVKLDVEGHEKYALRGLAKTIARNRVVIQVEMFNERVDEIKAVLDTFDLREINAIYPDRYYTNIPADVLGV